MQFGYARVSSKSQNLERQIKALKDYGIKRDNIITEKQSGKSYENRPELMKLIDKLRDGDKVVVSSIDRLSRNYQDTKKLTAMIKSKGAMFAISSFKGFYQDNGLDSDFASMMNEFLINFMAYQAQMERKNIRKRQKQGIEIAKRQGKYQGRDKQYTDDNEQVKQALDLYNNGNNSFSMNKIAKRCGMSRSSLYRILKRKGLK